jgi:hypothetical protein
MPSLSSSLEKLGNLKHLHIVSISKTCDGDALSLVSPPSLKLESLDLLGWNFSRVPRWMGDLHNLRSLRLGLVLKKETNTTTSRSSTWWEEDVGIIGRLPSLVKLWLRMPTAIAERTVISCSMGFEVLEQFFIDCGGSGISYLTFEAGAMPSLWKVWLSFDPHGWDKVIPAGLQNLSRLKEIRVSSSSTCHIGFANNESLEDFIKSTEPIRGVFQEAAGALPNRPAVIIGFGPQTP